MSDGYPVPDLPDGMGCFDSEEGYVLLRNHELTDGDTPHPELCYERGRAGGVTRVLLDRRTLAVKDSRWVLTGTIRNCGGGLTPWGWLSCEEAREENHGWVFFVNAAQSRIAAPSRLPSLGRFRHEAAAFLPRTMTTFLTEDEEESALYCHIGDKAPFEGQLLALRARDEPHLELGQAARIGDSWAVDWVKVGDPSASESRTAHQAFDEGAARIRRGEGVWASGSSIYFVSTSGGPKEQGQIFRLDREPGADRLHLVAQAESEQGFQFPDGITVAPGGDLYFVEDGAPPNRIWRMKPGGAPQIFGENRVGGGESEVAGICFSPDGRTMFVNLQSEGLTLAVRGPFSKS